MLMKRQMVDKAFACSYEPYFSILPAMQSMTFEAARYAARTLLATTHPSNGSDATHNQLVADFDLIEKEVRRHLRMVEELSRRYYRKQRPQNPLRALAKDDALGVWMRYCHDVVISRCVEIPVGCTKSVPDDLPTLLEKHPRMPVLPTLVPVLDMINAASPTPTEKMMRRGVEKHSDDSGEVAVSNCTVYTCVARRDQDDSGGDNTPVKTRVVPGELLQRKRIVVCATRALEAGEELLLPYDTDDAAATAYRYGMVVPS